MIGISSRSAGVLLIPKPGIGEYAILDVVEGQEQDPVEAEIGLHGLFPCFIWRSGDLKSLWKRESWSILRRFLAAVCLLRKSLIAFSLRP
jgi:hypothetical protein